MMKNPSPRNPYAFFGIKVKKVTRYKELGKVDQASQNQVVKVQKISPDPDASTSKHDRLHFLKRDAHKHQEAPEEASSQNPKEQPITPANKCFLHLLEVCNAELARFFLGPSRSPSLRLVIEENGTFSVVSKEMGSEKEGNPFIPMNEIQIPESFEDLIKTLNQMRFGSFMMMTYLTRDKDKHRKNYGMIRIGEKSTIVNLDPEQGQFSLQAPLRDPNAKPENITFLYKVPHREDIVSLLSPQNRTGFDRPTCFLLGTEQRTQMESTPEFQKDKYLCALKVFFLSDWLMRTMVYPHIPEGYQQVAEDIIHDQADWFRQVKQTLQDIPAFRETILAYPQLIDEAKKELKEWANDFNHQHKKIQDPFFQVTHESIDRAFASLLQTIHDIERISLLVTANDYADSIRKELLTHPLPKETEAPLEKIASALTALSDSQENPPQPMTCVEIRQKLEEIWTTHLNTREEIMGHQSAFKQKHQALSILQEEQNSLTLAPF